MGQYDWAFFIGIAVVFLAVGGMLGATYFGTPAPAHDAHGDTHEETHEVHDEHMHTETLEVDFAPSVEIEVHEDPESGYNIHIMTENFDFSPERASTEHVDGEGHAHIYVDGKKISRVYGNWFHIGNPGEGVHEVRVTLNANSHEDFTIGGEKVSDTVLLDISGGDSHTHDDTAAHG